jgi:hypothetical protein
MFAGRWNTFSLPFSGRLSLIWYALRVFMIRSVTVSASRRTVVWFSIPVENFLFSMTFEMASRPTHSETDTGILVSGDKRDHSLLTLAKGRAIAQAVSSRLPTAAQIRAQVRSCGICGGQSGTETGFLRTLQFPLPILIPLTAPHSSSSSGARAIGQLVADVPSGLSLTPPQEINSNGICIIYPHSYLRLYGVLLW